MKQVKKENLAKELVNAGISKDKIATVLAQANKEIAEKMGKPLK